MNQLESERRGEHRAPAVLAGRYRMGEVIGRGAMATVYAARDTLLDREVAVKLFASQAGVADVPPALAAGLGLLVAGGVQAGRAAVRPAATAFTAGTANPLVSAAEDGLSLGLSVLALTVPALAGLGVILAVWWGVRLYRRWQAQRRAAALHPKP